MWNNSQSEKMGGRVSFRKQFCHKSHNVKIQNLSAIFLSEKLWVQLELV